MYEGIYTTDSGHAQHLCFGCIYITIWIYILQFGYIYCNLDIYITIWTIIWKLDIHISLFDILILFDKHRPLYFFQTPLSFSSEETFALQSKQTSQVKIFFGVSMALIAHCEYRILSVNFNDQKQNKSFDVTEINL